MYKRILSLLAILSLAATLAIAVSFPKLEIGSTRKPSDVTVATKQPTLICPGPVFLNGGDSGLKLGNFTQSGTVAISGRDGENSIASTSTTFKTILGSSAASKDFNAIQIQNSKQKLAAGLAVANCMPGSSEAWFVAGDNSVGREALLVLVNPTLVDATVSLQLIGTDGSIQGTGLSGISAPAGKVTTLPLAAFAPKTATFAVKVSSRGAALGMWLQQKTIRGLTPGGLDIVGPSANAGKMIDIPGLFIRNSARLAKLSNSDDNYLDLKPLLRIANTGKQETTFTAQVQGADGSSFGTVIQGTVAAGSVRDFELDELTDGDYIVHIEANQTIMGAVRFSRGASGEPDLAWANAVSSAKLDAGFTAAVGAISKLSLANSTEQSGTLTLNGRKIQIPENSNLVIPLTAGVSYQLSSNAAVSISQVVDIAGAVAVVPVLDYRSEVGRVKVLVR